MDLRMACLHRAKVNLQAVTNLLAQADAGVVENAQRVTSGLLPLERCADIEALQVDVPPPHVADAAAVEEARAELAAVSVLVDAGKYEDAQKAARALADRAGVIGYGPVMTEIWVILGIAHQHAGAYAESAAAFKQALRSGLRWRQRAAAQDAASWLVEVHVSLGSAVDAFAYATTARALLLPGEASTEAALTARIGSVLRLEERWVEAEAAYRDALEQHAKALEPDFLSLSVVRNDLAVALHDQGRYVEAEVEQRDNLRLLESKLGSEHPEVGISRLNFAGMLFRQGRYEDAQQEYAAALSSIEKALGSQHPTVGIARHNLAHVALARGDVARSEAEERLAIAVLSRAFGVDHPAVASARQTLATALLRLGRHRDAETEQRAALELRLKLHGPQHIEVAQSRYHLGDILFRQGRVEEAEAEHRAALALREKALDPAHPDVAHSRNALADVIAQQQRVKRGKKPSGEASP